MKVITEFGGQNWVIKPLPLAFNEPAPLKIQDQKWEITLTGIALTNIMGGNNWVRETILIHPDIIGPIKFIMNKHRFAMPTVTPYVYDGSSGIRPFFQVEQWAPYAALGTIYDANTAINAGFAVDTWRPNPFNKLLSNNNTPALNNIFTGVLVDVGTNDNDAILYRVNYHFTLIGKIVFANGVVF